MEQLPPRHSLRFVLRFALLTLATTALLSCQTEQEAGTETGATGTPNAEVTVIDVPSPDVGADRLASRRDQQLASADEIGVAHAFHFEDRVDDSKITFVHQIVDDAGRDYKAVHYDHGNGVSAADVDGDGHLDLLFLSQLGGNELWMGQGDGTFVDATDRAGVALADRINVAASFGDVDNDGDPDLYVSTVRMGNVFFRNEGDGTFVDATDAAGLQLVAHSSGSTFFDYDRDGDLDLFVTNVGRYTSDERGAGGYFVGLEDAFDGHEFPERFERSHLYRNDGTGHFDDVTEAVGLDDESWSGDVSITDIDEDGWPDLYVLNMQGDDHLWHNERGTRFEDVTDTYFPLTPWGAMGIKFFDWNHDGLFDLLLTDMHSDMVGAIDPAIEHRRPLKPNLDPMFLGSANNLLGNAFWERQSGSRFTEIALDVGAENYWPWGVSVADLNADGWEDAFLASSMNFPLRYGINSLLLNERGETFRAAEFALGIEPRAGGATRKTWFELDCSTEADRAHALCDGLSGPVEVTGALGTRSSIVFDLEGDGDLDLITAEFNARPQVLVSDLAQQEPTHWIEVRLRGTRSNRDAIGAKVHLETASGDQYRYHDTASGYLSHSLLPLWFGLGAEEAATSIEVTWPTGETQRFAGPFASGSRLELVEGQPNPVKTG